MGDDSKLAGKIKAQVSRFCGDLTEGMNKPGQRFLREMFFGILASEDVKLSSVSRSLGEEIALIKTENRLSRQMASRDWTGWINEELIHRSGWRVSKETVLALDLTDVQKPYGKKMEGLNYVWDGSEGTPGLGYEICEVVAAEVKGDRVLPLYSELYSSAMEGFESENSQILKSVDAVMDEVGEGRGVFTIDRGGDRKTLLEGLLARSAQFIVRMVGTRDVIVDERRRNLIRVARSVRCRYQREVMVETKEGIRQKRQMAMGVKEIRLKFWSKPLWLVVIKGWWTNKPIMLLTNLEFAQKEEFAQKVLEMYLTRWKCEEGFRFIKQSYQLEDVRVRSLVALRNTVVIVHAIFYFVSVVLGERLRMGILLSKLCAKALRFFEIPSFKQYAVADGIYRTLFGRRLGSWGSSDSPLDKQAYLPLNCVP